MSGDIIFDTLTRMGAKDIRQTSEGYECQCPLCRSTRRSFRVARRGRNKKPGAFICHKCEAIGDLTGLVMKAYQVPRTEAEDIAKNAGEHIIARSSRKKEEFPKPDLSEVVPFREILSEYLVERGFDEDWIYHYKIGMDPFTNEIVIPTYDLNKELVGVTRRIARSGFPYIHSRFPKSDHVCWLDLAIEARAKGAQKVYVVEGQADVLGLAPLTDPDPVVSIYGSFMSNAQAKLLVEHFGEYGIILALDNDPAGIKGTRQAVKVLRKQGATKLQVLRYPTSDPGDLIGHNPKTLSYMTTSEWLHQNRNTQERKSYERDSRNGRSTARERGC